MRSPKIQREVAIITFFLGAILTACFLFVLLPVLAYGIASVIAGFAVAVILLGGLAFWVTMNKEKVLGRIFGVDRSGLEDVKESSKELVGSLLQKDRESAKRHFERTFRQVSAWYVGFSYRRWVIGVFYTLFLGFGGMLGSVLIYNQNSLIIQQNELMRKQNVRLDQQTYLLEAQRRSSLVFLLGNILESVDRELKEDYGLNGRRDLSPQLTGQVIALSKSLRPYRYLESDTLIQKALSPERGQLLICLIESRLDISTYDAIFRKSDFSYSDLNNVNLNGAYLNGADLYGCNLSGAEISGAKLVKAKLIQADISRATLIGTDLSESELYGASFSESDLSHAVLRGVYAGEANFNTATLGGANFKDARLNEADLRFLTPREEGLWGGFSVSSFEGANLESAMVEQGGLLDSLSQQADTIPAVHYLHKHYEIIPAPKKDLVSGEKYYLLKARH